MSSIKGVVYDLDGTILDAEPLYEKADRTVLESFGHTLTWEVKSQIVGKPERVGARIYIDHFDIALTEDEFLQRRGETLRELFPKAQPMKGAVELVHHLKHRCGLPSAIATSSWRHNLSLKKLNNAALFNPIDAVICGDDEVVKRGKPHPDIFIAAAKAIGVDPADCIAFEDSPSGVEAAYRAGMKVFAVPDERMDASLFPNAHEIISSLFDFRPEEYGLLSFDGEEERSR